MLSLNNDFIGYHPLEHNVAFSGSDTEELFSKNLKLQPADWYYRANPISYVRNMHGHRCNEIENIDLDNYILFAGCSHTEGIGLHLENSYPYLLSKKLNVDYYNLALGGTGADVINHNIVTWFTKVKKPPKLLIVQWPHHTRAITKDFSNPTNLEVEPWLAYGVWDKKAGIFFSEGENLGIFKSTRILTKKIVNNISPCPVIEVVTPFDGLTDKEFRLIQVDGARDIKPNSHGHMGRKSELISAGLLYRKINIA